MRLWTAVFIVPAVLAVADVAANRTALKYLLLPPLGALTYILFINPTRVRISVWRIVVSPTVTALWAWALASTIGYNVASVILATLGVMAIMWVFDAVMMVPNLALALLSILQYRQIRGQFDYVLSVMIFTVCVYTIYVIWRRLPLDAGVRPQHQVRSTRAE